MNNEEILKALRCCVYTECTKCPLNNGDPMDIECVSEMVRTAADLIEKMTDRCARYAEEIAVLQERQKWVPVTERLPEPETDVLAVCNRNGCIFVVQAIYEDGKMLTEDSAWNWNDICEYGLYDEENDDYYIPEGWWEDRQFTPDDVYNNPIDCAVTHWMPLPDGLEVEKNDKAD